ncbi:monooxygenase, partial [Salmonella enterica subsp. enterica serovar Typhimurium]|uniref:FAD-dependent oxidoreductase n=1 Tax=Salmonella enterica TaxID=28901 RepID=UPI000CB7D287
MANNQFDVIVVGAGPVGMTAGLALQQKGISSVVVEANSKDTPRPGSRAIFIHKASMELLEKTSKGLGFEIAHNG